MTRAPDRPKIYHIVCVDRLSSILEHDGLLSDAEVSRRGLRGTAIGIENIKERRRRLEIKSQSGLHVGDCVPFYFCPRSVMLFIIYRKNYPELDYRGGQERIIHLEAGLHDSVAWADKNQKRWAFTLSNAGSYHFEDRNNLDQLDEIHWGAVQATEWQKPEIKERKQAEFLMESFFPWELVERVGVHSENTFKEVNRILLGHAHCPRLEIPKNWYY